MDEDLRKKLKEGVEKMKTSQTAILESIDKLQQDEKEAINLYKQINWTTPDEAMEEIINIRRYAVHAVDDSRGLYKVMTHGSANAEESKKVTKYEIQKNIQKIIEVNI